jgi:hypothetical protein
MRSAVRTMPLMFRYMNRCCRTGIWSAGVPPASPQGAIKTEERKMNRYVLIACCSKKADKKSYAADLYISDLFAKSMAYAKNMKPDKIFILSAKYGLLELDDEIFPYDETLKEKSENEKRVWAKDVLIKLSEITDPEKDEFIFLAGNDYRKHLLPKIKNHKIPLLGLPIGKQLQWLKENTK